MKQSEYGALRALVRGTYDIQKMRIQFGNRVVGQFKSKILGQRAGQPEEELDEDSRDVLDRLRERYKKLMDGIKLIPPPKKFRGDEIISTYTEMALVHEYIEMETKEDGHFHLIANAVSQFPLWSEFLEGVKGCGPAMSGVIMSEIDITKAKYPSSLWKYSGLDVADDGAGRSRRKEHLIEVEYTNKKGETAVRDSITFNPFLKTKLTGVLGPSMLKSGRWIWTTKDRYDKKEPWARRIKKVDTKKDADKAAGVYGGEPKDWRGHEQWQELVCDSPYAITYYDYKHRLEHREKYAEDTKGHRHNMSIRYLIKMFLVDLHKAWRTLEGLPVSEPYAEAKLHMQPHSSAEIRSRRKTA